MAIKRILCPIDFSPQSEAALDFAVSIARDTGAEVTMLHVAEPIIIYGEVLPQLPDIVECRRRLESIRIDPGVRVCRHIVEGYAADTILAEACKENSDLIVMGTHGRTGISHMLMGSIAEGVVRKAPCPVLTLKPAALAEANVR